MLQYNPSISGSLSVTGSLIVTNGVIGTVNGVDVEIFSSSISQVVTNIQTTTGSQSGRLTSIESFTSSVSTTNTFTSSTSARLGSIETITASNLSRLNSIETITSSNISRLNSIETITASNISRLTSLEITTGSLATTGSNTFIGTQTITGSLFISSNLIVQGTSSLQNITASAVSIGTNLINLNTANPAIRYAGLVIGDSGSVGGSGSFLYDSVQDEMIFVHRGDSSVVTSSVTLMGPETYDNVGNETYPTLNIVQKGTGKEHLVDSCIFDNGTTTCIKNNLIGTGTITGTTIYGSTAVCSPVGKFTTCIDAGSGTFSGAVQSTDFRYTNTGYLTYDTANTGTECLVIRKNGTSVLTFNSNSSATFANMVCTNAGLISNTLSISCNSGDDRAMYMALNCSANYNSGTANTIARSVSSLKFLWYNNCWEIGATRGDDTAIQSLVFAKNGSTYLALTCHGIANFSCQICAPTMLSTYFSGTCLTLNGFSSGNGFKMDYGSASGQITAINLMANGTTNGFIGIQMVDGSNGDLWLGSSANRSMTIYRTTGHVGFGIDAPCTRIHAEGGYGSRWGGNGCFYGGGISGGGMPYGDIYGNGASYTYQTCNGNANNSSLYGGFAAGYFKGGPGSSYGGGGAGIVAIGGDGGNAESVNAGGGAGIFARAGKNGAGSAHSYAGWFDGGDVMVRCGSVLSCAPKNGYNFRALGFATGTIASGGSCLIFSNLDRGLYLISIASSVTSTFGYSAFLWVDSANITVSSVIRQSCVAISTSGRYLCVVNQYTAEAASMTITTLNLLNYIG